MVREQTHTAKPIPRWIVVALSIAMIPIGLIGALFTTLSIAGSIVTRADYASAVIFVVILGVACAIAAIGTWRSWVFVVPAVASLLLITVGSQLIDDAYTGRHFSVVFGPRSLTYAWLLVGIVVSAPLVMIGIRESNRAHSNFRVLLCIFLAITVPLVLLLNLAVPIQSEANAQYKSYQLELARNREVSKSYAAEEKVRSAAAELRITGLKKAADRVVLAISDSYDKNGYIPQTYVEPEGYEITTYTVQNKAKVEFCIKPKDSSSYLGVIVDPSVSDGTMYWYTEPRGGSCEYSYDGMRQL